jgi:hypothetical protein
VAAIEADLRKTHLERYQEQCATEDALEHAQRLYRFRSEHTELHAAKLPVGEIAKRASEIAKRLCQSLDQQDVERDKRRFRWSRIARARDRLDELLDRLRREARPLKRQGRFLGEEDLLASSLKVVAEALIRYEALAKLGYLDPHPLNEFANVLQLAFYVPPIVKKMTESRKQASPARQRRTAKAQARRKAIIEGASERWSRHPNHTSRPLRKTWQKGSG